jgi:hypothetical protein
MLSCVGATTVSGGNVVGTGVAIGVCVLQIAGVKVGGGAKVLTGVLVGPLAVAGTLVRVETVPGVFVTLGMAEGVGELLIEGVSDGGGVILAVAVGVSVLLTSTISVVSVVAVA